MPPSLRHAVAGLLALGVLAAAVLASPAATLARVRDLLFSPLFPLVLVGLYLVRPLLAWPITLLSALVGYRYGLWVGVPLALCGAVVTSLLPYAAAGWFRTDAGLLGRAAGGSARYFGATGDLRGVAVARLLPTPAEAVSAAAGLAGVSVPAFVLGTLVGEFPWTVAAVLVGSSMHRFSVAGLAPDPRLFAGAAALAALLLARPAYRWYRGRAPA